MKVAVLGAYQTKFGELWDKSLADLIYEAGNEAIKDSQIDKKEIQAGFLGNKLGPQTTGQNHLGALMSEVLDIKVPIVRVEAACASGGVAVAQAVQSIKSGQYELALVVGAEKMTDVGGEQIAEALMGAASEQEHQAGLTFPGLYALIACEYFVKYGADQRDLAKVAIKNHYHASFNPKAQFPFTITEKQTQASSEVAWPLRLLDCSGVTDGAAAVVLASEKIASRFKKNKVFISASCQASDTLSLDKRTDITTLVSTKTAAKLAFLQAGLERKDVDFIEAHDCFTIAEIIALEDLGFYKKGQGYLAYRKNELRLGGKLAVNLSGGLKACGHPVGATGVKQIVEVYNQLSNRAEARQSKNAKVALTHNVGGTGGTVVVHILNK